MLVWDTLESWRATFGSVDVVLARESPQGTQGRQIVGKRRSTLGDVASLLQGVS